MDLARSLPAHLRPPTTLGLQPLTLHFFPHLAPWKPKSWRQSDGRGKQDLFRWDRLPLLPWQLEYCALDGWAGRAVHDALVSLRDGACGAIAVGAGVASVPAPDATAAALGSALETGGEGEVTTEIYEASRHAAIASLTDGMARLEY